MAGVGMGLRKRLGGGCGAYMRRR